MNAHGAKSEKKNGTAEFVLHLFVSGQSDRSARAIVNLRKVCEEHLKGRYELKVVDVTKDPGAAVDEQLIALPTLVKKFPIPQSRFIGDLSNTDRLLANLRA